eukprot:GHVH01017386.1.p1 GENE.GHVH01017386.1~~GHVH01017386.1.p1  ORF type:complete len:844 (+),score=134.89 GHVH01017386.1:2513-5044(+)
MAPKSKAKGKAKGKSYVKKNSEVMCFGPDGQPFKNFNVWCWAAGPVADDKDKLFVKASVQPGSTEEVLQCMSVPDENGAQEAFECPMDRVFNCNSAFDEMNTHDIGMLVFQNIPSVLDFMTARYVKKQIYLTADPLQIAINPFANPGTGGDDYILKIRDENDPDKCEPHSFTTTRFALDNAWAVMKAQTVIVSGESGAGKTEAVKMAMRYCAAAKSGKLDDTVQKAVLGANPVLEAFGNAKTVRNNNSSRFGRYMQLAVEKAGGINAGSVQNFLLEKGRIVSQMKEERNYHIFYQMLKCATPEQRKDWHLKGLKEYNFINPLCDTAPGMDDAEEWADCMSAYKYMKMPTEHVDSLYKIMSACLLLGEIVLEEQTIDGADAAIVTPASRDYLIKAAELVGVDPDKMEDGFLVKVSMAGGTEIRGRWPIKGANTLLQSLAKALFDETFNWFVKALNKTIEPEQGFSNYLGILDIFGFEVFENNSLEQLFINVTNEALQKNFTDVVFDRESKLYKAEGVSCGDLVFSSNEAIINCLTAKTKSFFSTLEDQCLAPGANDQKLLAAAYKLLEKDYPDKFLKPKVNGDRMFNIEHTIGPICYTIDGFIEKNMDILRPDLVEVIQTSTNPVAFALYEGVEVVKGKSAKGSLIASQYLTQLNALMDLINTTEPSFIRCIKPNDCKTAFKFVNAKVLIQLFSLSILEALQLKTIGFAYRRPFIDFIAQFKFVDLGAANSNQDDCSKAKAIIATAKLDDKSYGVGKTMIFLKSDGVKTLGRKQREKMAAWVPVVVALGALQQRNNLRKVYNPNAHKKMSRLSALARRKLAGKVAAPAPKDLGLGWYRPRDVEV